MTVKQRSGMILVTEARRQFRHALWLGFVLGVGFGIGLGVLFMVAFG